MSVDIKAEKKARQAAEASQAMADYRAAQAAVDANTQRLRALRLERESSVATAPVEVKTNSKAGGKLEKPKKKAKAKAGAA